MITAVKFITKMYRMEPALDIAFWILLLHILVYRQAVQDDSTYSGSDIHIYFVGRSHVGEQVYRYNDFAFWSTVDARNSG